MLVGPALSGRAADVDLLTGVPGLEDIVVVLLLPRYATHAMNVSITSRHVM